MREKTRSRQDEYLEKHFGLPDADLRDIEDEMRRQHCEGMALSTPELRLLQFLVQVSGAKRVLEIGTLYGRSSLALARALPPGGTLTTIEKDPRNHQIAQGFLSRAPEANQIRQLLGPAKDILQSLASEPDFDFILIDADKAGYLAYLDWAEDHLSAGGLIVGDNSFLWGGVWDEPSSDARVKPATAEIMKKFNLRLSDPQKYVSMIVPTLEGMTVAQKKQPAHGKDLP